MLYKKILYFSLVVLFVAISACSKDDNNPTEPKEDPKYTAADGINGGQLYDKFWANETGFDQTNANIPTFSAKPDFFRCKQCHGWDLLGTNGAYINRAPKTSRPNISSVNLMAVAKAKTETELFNLIKNGSNTGIRRSLTADLSTYDPATNNVLGDQMPNFGAILTDAQIWDIVKFLKKEAIDVSTIYDYTLTGTYPTGSIAYANIGKDGNAASGDGVYTAKCASCHGADGKNFPLDGSTNVYLGKFMRSKPNETQHKLKFGQLGTSMVNLGLSNTDIKNLYKAVNDNTKYPD